MNDCVDNVFHNDSLYMKSLIGKSVSLDLVEVGKITGKIYVIDPIFKTVVLHKNVDTTGKLGTVFVLHHSIKTLEVLSHDVDEEYLRCREIEVEMQSTEDILTKKERLKKWLKKMYLNVEESGDYLKIDNHLLIMPPYGIDNCICNNTLVLSKVRNIISSMPDDFSS